MLVLCGTKYHATTIDDFRLLARLSIMFWYQNGSVKELWAGEGRWLIERLQIIWIPLKYFSGALRIGSSKNDPGVIGTKPLGGDSVSRYKRFGYYAKLAQRMKWPDQIKTEIQQRLE